MKYQSSRGKYSGITSAQAIKMGISPDGGLFVPDFIPSLNLENIEELSQLTYQERANYIFANYLTDFTNDEIEHCVNSAYNTHNFDDERIAPIIQLNNTTYIQELWHGPTCAFKDMALQILPYFLSVSRQKTGEKSDIVILVATSGDTGKAALEGFKDVEGTKIIVFFPEDGVSEVQKQQMITQEGNNVFVSAVKGNFDDAQSGVKNMFSNMQVAEILNKNNKKLSSANSINWGRLLPQIVYYISAYIDLRTQGNIAKGEKINFVVPTGNFGNILAGFYAMKMGVPINKLICAANANNVLTEFINTGTYNKNRNFEKTLSPSMDILISSNLERLLYELTNHDSIKVSKWMEELKDSGIYKIDEQIHDKIKQIFWSDYSTDQETLDTIKECWEKDHYLLDTHTAVAKDVYEKYTKETKDATKTVIISTASPYKFGSSVAKAVLDKEVINNKNEFEILNILKEKTNIKIPEGLKNLDKREIRHTWVSTRDELEKTVLNFLNIKDK
ncbi:Threonine synthase [Candidatus Syntrophocurvum alkaliphilum]|uniref:Threonine synthase n=1 Tax=Candidatus Syntrophocurvum alkaliphilum TaxID=2293317 RepID=A0A6I6DC31_9FIRM|nr:threonine synthase [Candidatus Syntrophocurvum alkaliphilum]QGT99819.1 Threonine synthase [Candidatus Syntrophocurvum alkaliphilum]